MLLHASIHGLCPALSVCPSLFRGIIALGVMAPPGLFGLFVRVLLFLDAQLLEHLALDHIVLPDQAGRAGRAAPRSLARFTDLAVVVAIVRVPACDYQIPSLEVEISEAERRTGGVSRDV